MAQSADDEHDHFFNIMVIGDSGVGKTKIISTFACPRQWNIGIQVATGIEVATRTVQIEDKKIKAQISDYSGMGRYRAAIMTVASRYEEKLYQISDYIIQVMLAKTSYKTLGALLIYDITRRQTFDNIQRQLREFRANTHSSISIMMLGNKADLSHLRQVTEQEACAFAVAEGLYFLETSALQALNTEEAFHTILTEIYHIEGKTCATFSYEQLKQATSNFSDASKIGEGGFGEVYKGNLLYRQVAIKMLKNGSSQEQNAFCREVQQLQEVRHPHIVRLVGTCPEKYALVYEFMSGGTLDARLHENLPWEDRMRIATEVCSALKHLHSHKPNMAVHCDLKPTNILLDANYSSKLSDFGLSQSIFPSQTDSTDHVTVTSARGTKGYLDLALVQHGRITWRVDVYAFGMLLLRLLTNKSEGYHLVEQVKMALQERRIKDLLDSKAKWPPKLAAQLAGLAVSCCNLRDERQRPHFTEIFEKLQEINKRSGRWLFDLFANF